MFMTLNLVDYLLKDKVLSILRIYLVRWIRIISLLKCPATQKSGGHVG